MEETALLNILNILRLRPNDGVLHMLISGLLGAIARGAGMWKTSQKILF